MVLHAWRLMSLRKHEEQVAQVQAQAAAEVEAARDAIARTSELDRLLAEATTQAREATERAELAEEAAAGLRNEVASMNAAVIDVTDELRAAKSGSYTERSLDARFDRIEQIVAENVGPAPEPGSEQESKRKRARPSKSTAAAA